MSKLGGSLVACDAPSPIPSLVSEEQHVEGGGRVLFEHPWAAKSWNDSSLKELFEMDGMRRVRCGQCLSGQTSVDDAGNASLLAKTTGFMTKDENIAEAVERRGFGGHEHIQTVERWSKGLREVSSTIGGGDLVRLATEQACRGMRRSTRADGT